MSAAVYGPYSPVVRSGDYIFVSGQLGHINAITGDKNGDIISQTRQCLENLRALLQSENASLDDVVKTTVFLKNADDFPKMNEAYAPYFAGQKPARSTVIVGLLNPDMLIEIECVAFKPK